MRVCFVSGEFPPMHGGVADYTAHLGSELVHRGLHVDVVTSTKARPQLADDGGTQPPSIHTVTNWGYSMWQQIIALVEKVVPDILHIQYQTGAFDLHPAINLLPLRLSLRYQRPRTVVTFHDLRVPYILPKAGALRHLANTALVRGSDAVIVTNAEDARQLNPGKGSNGMARPPHRRPRVYQIPIGSNIPVNPPTGYDRESWRHRLGIGRDELLISYFGFLSPSKGVDVLLESLTQLLQSGNSVKLLIIGGTAGISSPTDRAYERRVRELIDQSAYRGHILRTGFVGPDEVSASLLASDVCVLPFREGACLRHGTLIAAIVHGIPIVTTTSGQEPSVQAELRSGENCLLVRPNDAAAIARCIEQIKGSSSLSRRIAAGARSLGESFRWDSIADKTLCVYRELLDPERTPMRPLSQ